MRARAYVTVATVVALASMLAGWKWNGVIWGQ